MNDELVSHVEDGFFIECSRCANDAFTVAKDALEAAYEFSMSGWGKDEGRVYCPRCNG